MVRLRPIEARDADRMWESLQDPEANRLTGTTETFTRDQIDEWAATVSDRDGRYDWAITPGAVRDGQPVSDELIGEIVLNDLDEHARSANLRLALLPNYRGRGYGREAIFEVLRFAFEGRRTWTASGTRTAPAPREPRRAEHQPRARMLYESLGFREEVACATSTATATGGRTPPS